MIDEALIDEAARRLRKAAPAAQVILFGSSARGDDGRHSDLDFLVVQPEVENAAEESVRLRHALRDLLVPMDIVVVSEGEVAKWRDVRGSLVHAALAEYMRAHRKELSLLFTDAQRAAAAGDIEALVAAAAPALEREMDALMAEVPKPGVH